MGNDILRGHLGLHALEDGHYVGQLEAMGKVKPPAAEGIPYSR